MEPTEPQRPRRAPARPGVGADPADPRSEAPTAGTARPRPGQPGAAGGSKRTAGNGQRTNGNGNRTAGARGPQAGGQPRNPKRGPQVQAVPGLPGAGGNPDPLLAGAAVAVVDVPVAPAGGTDTVPRLPPPPPSSTGEPTGHDTAAAVPVAAVSVADAGVVAEPVVLPTIVPAEPDLAPLPRPAERVAPTTEPVPAVPVPTLPVAPGPATTSTVDPDGTGGLPSLVAPRRPRRQLRAPAVVPRTRRPRVRKVTRVVRHVDTWSVFKVALVFNAFVYLVCLTAGVLLWQVAQNTGTVDNVERFFETVGWETFELKGGEIYHNAWVAGLFVGVGGTGLLVLAATLFNLITDLVGGIRVTVLEEEVVAREERGIGWRRAARRHAAADAAAAEAAGDPSAAAPGTGPSAAESAAPQPG